MSPSPSPTASGDAAQWTRAMLVVLLAGASFAFSLAFACATPFAGLAAVAVLGMRRRDALAAVTLVWFVNQANGFLFLHYPWTWSCVGWGLAIWAAAVAAVYGAAPLARLASRRDGTARVSAALGTLICAFVAYEAVLLAATLVLPSEPSAFSLVVVSRLFAIDVATFALLLAVIGTVRTLGLRTPGLGHSPGPTPLAQAR